MSRYRRFALGGLQTGITGALVMLAWLAITSLWSRKTIWWVPNLVASVHYGERSLRFGAGVYTVVGIAMILFLYGTVGLFFGIALKDRPGGFRVLCFALVVALVVYYTVLRWFWKAANPMAHMYAPDTQILMAHLIFGLFLARYPNAIREEKRIAIVESSSAGQ
jgi:hypothetical protein